MLITSVSFEGERLPSERTAVQLGVSRPSVREALIALKFRGWSGQARASSWPKRIGLTVPSTRGGALRALRARWLIEGEIAALSARESTKADLARAYSRRDDAAASQQESGHRRRRS
jgi:DNA-binding FadR family transcriptional regulator